MSSPIGFNHGSHFLLDGREVQVTRVINGQLITLEDVISLVVQQHSMEQLLTWWTEGRISSMTHLRHDRAEPDHKHTDAVLSSYPQAQIDNALRRKRYLDALRLLGGNFVFTPAKLNPILKEIAAKFGELRPPSASSIYNWWKRFERHGESPAGLIDRFDTRGWFGCRFPTEVQDVLIELTD